MDHALSDYQSLDPQQPWIIAIAGVLYLLEFFADKVPWIDTAWDTVHTIIQPIGGALRPSGPGPSLGRHGCPHHLTWRFGQSHHAYNESLHAPAQTVHRPASNIGRYREDLAVFGGLVLLHVVDPGYLDLYLGIAAFVYFARKFSGR